MKKMFAALLGVLLVGWNANAGTVAWEAFSFQSLFNSSGSQIVGQNLVVQLIVDVDNDTSLSSMISAGQFGIGSETAYGGQYNPTAVSDDIVVGTGQWTWFDVYSSSTINQHAAPTVTSDVGANYGVPFYMRWFDDSGTEVGIIYSASFITPPNIDPPGSTTASYAFGAETPGLTGTINGENNGWATVAPVPEPTTMALMGLGLAAVAVRRRFAKKA